MKYTITEIIEAAKIRGWKENKDYQLPDLIQWVENRSKNKALDDILDEWENEPTY